MLLATQPLKAVQGFGASPKEISAHGANSDLSPG
jgi:hypothetical protein